MYIYLLSTGYGNLLILTQKGKNVSLININYNTKFCYFKLLVKFLEAKEINCLFISS